MASSLDTTTVFIVALSLQNSELNSLPQFPAAAYLKKAARSDPKAGPDFSGSSPPEAS
jgi:hypothetical protein